VIVGVFYVAVFLGLGFDISVAPFLGAAVLFCGALMGVLHYQRRKHKKSGN
jgi:hypothetical protein